MDAANLLKPMLARGELRCIGATTLEEYKKVSRCSTQIEPATAGRAAPPALSNARACIDFD